jgi:hypothetical protein
MKKIIGGFFGAVMIVAALTQTHAQSTLVYDQQSTKPPSTLGDYLDIQPEPLTQSFIPALSAIGFVQFEFWDIPDNGNNGATVYVNLWTGSPNINSATLLGSTTPVYMPDGFGSIFAGVTNFYFSSAIALTPGQTYYLQPVVQSGDNPWDIWDPGNTYPNGQLYGSGAFFQPSTDLWFREGVVSVPEPTALVLIGLSSILAYAFKRRSKLFVLFGVGLLLSGLVRVQALPVQSTPDTVVEATADAAGLTPASATALPRTGTFWVMMPGPNGKLTALPYPTLPASLSDLPTYSVTGNTFIVDDTGGNTLAAGNASSTMRRGAATSSAMMASTLQAQANTVADLIEQIQTSGLYPPGGGTNGSGGFYSDSFNYPLPTNGLWLETYLNADRTNLWLRLHGTVESDNYQLLSVTNPSNTNWDLGELLFVLGQFAGFGDNFFKVNLQSHGDSQQGVQCWDSQFLFNKTHCLARQPGFLGNQIERKPAFCPFLFQKTGDLRAHGFGCFANRHAKAIHEKRLTIDATLVA